MRRLEPRLAALAARVPRGCPACRSWCGTVLVGDAGDASRPERCPGCGRLVPIATVVHVVGVDLALV